jgi:sugar lactone lactonase YvrE
MKTQFKTILILILALTIFGCSKDENNPPKEDFVPTITGIDPDNGIKNTVVTINGDNFGTDMSKVRVFFNDMEAIVQSVSNNQIKAMVPPRAYSGFVRVIVNSTELMGPEFIYFISDYLVSTLAGSTQGFADGTGTSAQFDTPRGMAIDPKDNLYVVDQNNHRIRKITPDAMVTTFAGSTIGFSDGIGSAAMFYDPIGIAVDQQGNVYVGDSNNNRVRKITANGDVSTLAGSTVGYADGTGGTAQFDSPYGIAVDALGNVYVADLYNHKIRKVTSNGEVSTLAGSAQGLANGLGSAAQFNSPVGVAVDTRGNVYVGDSNNHQIRKINSAGVVTTIAGSIAGFKDGAADMSQFDFPSELTLDVAGNLYVTDGNNQKIRKVTVNGDVSTLAGSTFGFADGLGASAQFSGPYGIVWDSDGTIYVADSNNHKIRKMVPE